MNTTTRQPDESPSIAMDEHAFELLVEKATQAAIDAGAKVIQDAFGVKTGDLAGVMLTSNPLMGYLTRALADYAAAQENAVMDGEG